MEEQERWTGKVEQRERGRGEECGRKRDVCLSGGTGNGKHLELWLCAEESNDGGEWWGGVEKRESFVNRTRERGPSNPKLCLIKKKTARLWTPTEIWKGGGWVGG